MNIYNRLSLIRTEANISRQALADAVKVNTQTIGFLERGDYYPSLELAFAIAEFFDVDINTIFSTHPFDSVFKKRSKQ